MGNSAGVAQPHRSIRRALADILMRLLHNSPPLSGIEAHDARAGLERHSRIS
ncbi:hypothetical protein [Paenibacillus apiarius]|uniref:GntR family transcriptional regulator n=1 Tax=Paenibacillus apiarius TaxID=46240 RepID=A0ABT4DYC7_9BACL|nr:hypothetical protein [Paenibacillus apiarius]MCY9520966.1 hypothetical protein [Paenibacillus apiarius]